jgi:hypothetical protein
MRVTDHALCDTTEKHSGNAASAVTADDDSVGIPRFRPSADLGVRNALLDEKLDAMRATQRRCVLLERSAELGFPLRDL